MSVARIAGTGSFLPEKVLTNEDLEKMVETSSQWIIERTGIERRHIAAPGETTSDMAVAAARHAIDAAGIEYDDIDLVIVGTTTPDKVFPSTAALVQDRLNIRGCPAFDVQAVCTGFVYALSIAEKFIRTDAARHALVIGADTNSRIIDWTDRGTCVLFGDGAGAVVLSANDDEGEDASAILSTHLHADGVCKDLLHVPWGVGQGYDRLEEGNGYMVMQGNEVFKRAVKTLGQIVTETLDANGMAKSDVDWLVPHQANTRIIKATAKKLGMSMEQVVMTIADHGNTSGASVPLALDTAVRDGRIQRGQVLLLEAFGAGFTWGSALIRY